MRFIKAHAYGNDFLYVEQTAVSHVPLDRLAREICDRHTGVGADGLIVYAPTPGGASMQLFNADGSPSEVSGNGVRGLGALLERSEPSRRLACLVLDDPRSVALGSEPIRIGGKVVGRVTSGGYGYTVERSIAYGYVPADVTPSQEVEVDIFGEWVDGHVADEPLFDPEGERIRA